MLRIIMRTQHRNFFRSPLISSSSFSAKGRADSWVSSVADPFPFPGASSAPPFVFWHLWRQVSPWFWQPQLPQLPRARQCRQQQGCQILMNLPISTTLSSKAAISQIRSMRSQAAELLRSRPVSVAQKAPIAWRSCLRCMHSGVICESHIMHVCS